MEIIQEIGSYAGFAAVVGLAVLSALYFSQARDVKRLREWAGRAPERGPSPVPQPQRVVAQPIAKPAQPPTGAQPMPPVPRPPGAQPGVATPAAAQASAAGAAPAVAKGPAPATPAATPPGEADGEEARDDETPDVTAMDTVVHPPPPPPDDDAQEDGDDEQSAGDATADDVAAANGEVTDDREPVDTSDAAAGDDGGSADDVGEVADEDTGEWSPEDEHSDFGFTDEHDVVPATPAASAVRPPQPPRPFPRRGTPAPRYERGDRTTIIPPYSESRPGAENDATPSHGRRPILVAIAAVVVIAIGAFAVLQIAGGGDDGSDGGGLSAGQASNTGNSRGGGGGGTPAIDPSQVTVAVLNGTTVPGLAATLGDKIAGEGFQLGTVTNNFDQERAESVVLYAPGAEDEATAVARQLDITQREPIDPDSQSLAGDATVVVVAGADQNQ
jgi:hypothetical protein